MEKTMKKKTKTTRKKKENLEWESQTVPYVMLEDLCNKQYNYIEHRDRFLQTQKDHFDRAIRHNYKLQKRVEELEERISNQEGNIKLFAEESWKMWHELESCGNHETFLQEKININLEFLESKGHIKH